MLEFEDDILALARLMQGKSVVLLTGAGCSTASGIPDYRGPKTINKPRNPIEYLPFVRKPEVRQRYWARSGAGWPVFDRFLPNATHEIMSSLEQMGIVKGIITQNVDRLHSKAGSQNVVELHGALANVFCLTCKAVETRDHVQQRIMNLNPGHDFVAKSMAPDGDADVKAQAIDTFRVPACMLCGGVLKPDVVFFGENVPSPVIERAWALFEQAEVLLVVGSSLTVFSGYRFALKAAKKDVPICLVNLGPTRADGLATIKIDGDCGEILTRLLTHLK